MTNVTSINNINKSAPTLSSSCVLVNLSISMWEGRKKDKGAEKEVEDQNHAKRGVTNVTKALLSDCEELNAIKKFKGAMLTAIHYPATLPWSNSGLAMLPMKNYFNYNHDMTGAQAEFYRLVDDFIDAYSMEVAKAQVSLGALFNPNDYPTTDYLRGRFSFTLEYIPLPEAGDFRVDIANEQAQHLQEQYQKFYDKQYDDAMATLWDRLRKPLSNLVEKIDYQDPKSKKIFRNTLVENVMEVVTLMESMNIHNDAAMAKATKELASILDGVDPDDLRASSRLRNEVRGIAREVLNNIPVGDDDGVLGNSPNIDTQAVYNSLPSLM